MQRLRVDLGSRSYPILIGSRLLADRALLRRHVPQQDLAVITDTHVAPLYLARLCRSLGRRRIVEIVLPAGEAHKSAAMYLRILDVMVSNRLSRDACVIALGGGVVGDIAGFAAASYQRGVSFVQLPTTLLSQVDSSVGGKTAINHPGGKNLIGAFHQPRAVITDVDTLATLPSRELRAGLAEVIKSALIADADFFGWIERNLDALLALDPKALMAAIRRSCRIKAAIVGRDERESGERALLNLGHTFGHAIETATGYDSWLHGEAVAAGLAMAAALSVRTQGLSPAAAVRIVNLLERAGLPTAAREVSAARALELMRIDKKVKNGRNRLILLRRIGKAVISDDYPPASLRATVRAHFA
ncbi:MAG: 3-dehydroquinate synthase [Steroidobacteraceae bacterium]